MNPLFEIVHDVAAPADTLRRRRYGMIEVAAGRLTSIRLRPWPKLVSLVEVMVAERWQHRRRRGDRLWLYYNQPWSSPRYLAITYALSTRDCSLASMHEALRVLDEVARIKHIDALVCDAWNSRISDRLLRRLGWESHLPSRWHRHYIKRMKVSCPLSVVSC